MKSVYIHIPFCKTICSYCDFCKRFYEEELAKKYLDALEKEISSRYKNEVISTLYIGGGTPNSLSDTLLEKLLNILSKIILNKEYEYTIECNIELLTKGQIKLFEKYGINRVSLGVQTFNEKYLSFLNRHHSKKEVFEKVNMLKEEGITNINVDFIYAIPGETLSEVESDIELFKKLDIPHISTYSLIIEDHTILKNNDTKYIDEDLDRNMYELIISKLDSFKHYETSNFAKEGFKSKHNLTYWNNENYYGFGLGASGYINNTRYDNARSMSKYLSGSYIELEENLSINETIENEFILGFRKIDGININTFKKKYNVDVLSIDIVDKLIKEGKLKADGDNLSISDEYIYTANSILIEFLGLDYERYI